MRNPISHIGKLPLIFLLTSFLLSGCSVGSHAPSDMGPINPAPIIIPEIVNWNGSTGHTDISELTYIVCPDEELKEIAETLQKDILVITGINLQIIYTQQKSADHTIILQIQDKKLLPEEYVLDIDLDILISGADTNAIFWGTRTLLQLILQDTNLPRGVIEDCPTYEVRGLGIDVARKPVSIDTLKEIIILMSWYKMNDLHLHLNDNALMAYVSDSAINAYSAFRLESQIKNDDGISITSEDYFYTLEEFAELLAFAKVYLVNIIPEFDTPAHSLAFIKVFPAVATIIWIMNIYMMYLSPMYLIQRNYTVK